MLKVNQDWMVRAKMLTLINLFKKEFLDQDDILLAHQLIKDIKDLLDHPTLHITDACKELAREHLIVIEKEWLTME